LKVIVPWLVPKVFPLIVTVLPTGAAAGDRLVITGPAITVKLTPLLVIPPVTTVTLPVVAVLGTTAWMLVAVAGGTTVAATVPNFTVLRLGVVLNPAPLIVIVLPLMPEVGERLLIPKTVNGLVLLSTPLA
jgi:hypothetical protein